MLGVHRAVQRPGGLDLGPQLVESSAALVGDDGTATRKAARSPVTSRVTGTRVSDSVPSTRWSPAALAAACIAVIPGTVHISTAGSSRRTVAAR